MCPDFRVLSMLNCVEMYHYMKHTKCHDLAVPLVWYQMQFPGVDRYQHTVSIAHTVNLGAYSEGRVGLSALLPITFPSGSLYALATHRQSRPFLALLGLRRWTSSRSAMAYGCSNHDCWEVYLRRGSKSSPRPAMGSYASPRGGKKKAGLQL